MQKKQMKGFTLIELLAVIVILAIIALIAVPVIMNVITKARVSAFEDSAYGIVKAGEMYYTNKLLDAEGMTKEQEFMVNDGVFKNTTSDETLDLNGSMPKSGKVKVTMEGKVALAISNGEYCIRKATTESKVKAEKLSDIGNNCDYKKETATPNPVLTTTTDGKAIPACIADNTTCSTDDIKNGIKVGVKVNDSETKDFYVIKDESNQLTLIMSGNVGKGVAWSSDGSNVNGPVTALAYLKTQTAGWTNIPEITYDLTDDNTTSLYSIKGITAKARLLTMTEAKEFGCTTSSGSCPTWLFENCSNVGGSWISTADASYSDRAWCVSNGGSYGTCNVDDSSTYGVHPVVIISKSNI